MPDDHQLLVVAAGPAGPRVEQHLAAVLIDRADELGVGLLGLPQRLGLGPPEQAEHLHPPAGGAAEHVADGRAGAVEQFVQVAAEVQEVDLVARLGRVQLGVQPGEVAAPVHQRLDQVPDREGTQVSGGVGPVTIAQEPAHDGRVVDRVVGGILFEGVVSRLGSTWEHVRIVASPGPRAGRHSYRDGQERLCGSCVSARPPPRPGGRGHDGGHGIALSVRALLAPGVLRYRGRRHGRGRGGLRRSGQVRRPQRECQQVAGAGGARCQERPGRRE